MWHVSRGLYKKNEWDIARILEKGIYCKQVSAVSKCKGPEAEVSFRTKRENQRPGWQKINKEWKEEQGFV